MAKGLRVARPGSDALTGGIKDMLYTTETPSLKLFDFGTLTFSFSSDTTLTANVDHKLGYVPVYRVFFQPIPDLNRWHSDGHNPDNLDDFAVAATCLSQADDDEIQVIVRGFSNNTYKARYYIFEDRVV